jgi:Fe-Mn family superoxide dismutase
MHQAIAPLAVRPWTLNGLSERLLVSHYEHHYGSAVRTLNAVRTELAAGARGMTIGGTSPGATISPRT